MNTDTHDDDVIALRSFITILIINSRSRNNNPIYFSH